MQCLCRLFHAFKSAPAVVQRLVYSHIYTPYEYTPTSVKQPDTCSTIKKTIDNPRSL